MMNLFDVMDEAISVLGFVKFMRRYDHGYLPEDASEELIKDMCEAMTCAARMLEESASS
jgi:hypothetical protein